MESYDQIIYTIGDAARIADVKPYVLRYWETEFDLLRPEKSVTGQRCYRPRDLRIVLTLKRLLHREGFTIVGARKKLSEMPESEWETFPPSSSSDGERILPPGRSVTGTVDAHEKPEAAQSESHAKPVDTNPVMNDHKNFEEFNRLWSESVHILNKYPN
jgi:DNA-binding transcriptional MerR regulator